MTNPAYIELNTLLNNVAKYMKVSKKQLVSKSKKYPLPDTRHLFIIIAQNRFPQIPENYISQHIKRSRTINEHVKYKIENDYTFIKLVNEFEKTTL